MGPMTNAGKPPKHKPKIQFPHHKVIYLKYFVTVTSNKPEGISDCLESIYTYIRAVKHFTDTLTFYSLFHVYKGKGCKDFTAKAAVASVCLL